MFGKGVSKAYILFIVIDILINYIYSTTFLKLQVITLLQVSVIFSIFGRQMRVVDKPNKPIVDHTLQTPAPSL